MMNATKRLEQLRELAAETAQEMARSDALFLSIGDGAIATNERGVITRINQVALSILGFNEMDLIGEQFTKVIIATDSRGTPIPTEKRPITLSFKKNKAVSRRCYYVRSNGLLVPVSVTVSPIFLDQKPVGAIEVFRDISEELEVDRIKSEFISIASHELRTPATAVKAYLGMLLEGYAGDIDPSQLKFIQMAYDNNERQLKVLNDLLYVTKTESDSVSLKLSVIDVSELVASVVERMDEMVTSRSQNIALTIPKGVVAKVDVSFMRMVIENLVSNASKYTPAGGKIAVSVAGKPQAVEISVSDNGVGINPSQMHKLFKKFSRIDNSLSTEVSGSGIGLYLVKQIIELHNGNIKVKSTPNRGSVFTVSIPVQG